MLTAEALKRKIQSADDLLSVVKTMKALAAVSIRQYQRAVEALLDYSRNVEMGLQVVLRSRPREEMAMGAVPLSRVGAIVFGSDQGLCGQFNAQVVAHALDELDRLVEQWIAGVRGLDEAGLAAPCGPSEGPWAEHPMAELVLHINREVIHHGAEIALLRDLYAHRPLR